MIFLIWRWYVDMEVLYFVVYCRVEILYGVIYLDENFIFVVYWICVGCLNFIVGSDGILSELFCIFLSFLFWFDWEFCGGVVGCLLYCWYCFNVIDWGRIFEELFELRYDFGDEILGEF